MDKPEHLEANGTCIDTSNCKPQFDFSIWLRQCDEEVVSPITGVTTGEYPKWLKGALVRNGPGLLAIGQYNFKHLFDGPALLHRFEICDGKATYQCRFLQSRSYKKNKEEQRIVFTEFGTQAVPDPCRTIFQRFSSIFHPPEVSDNSNVSIYPFADEYYAVGEYPEIHRIDPTTLDTLKAVNVLKKVNLVHHTSHPHVEEDGHVFNTGLSVTGNGPKYSVISFPKTRKGVKKTDEDVFSDAEIVGTVPTRWSFHPGYMHSFGITASYFVIIEQPLCISVTRQWALRLLQKAPASMFKTYEKENTLIHVLSRNTGQVVKTFACETFFFFHTINQYEEDGNVIMDVCAYNDGCLIDLAFINALKGSDTNAEFINKFKSKPSRYILPLDDVTNKEDTNDSAKVKNGTKKQSKIVIKPELLCDTTCEMPRINYPAFLGKKYRYFYGIHMNPEEHKSFGIIKVDALHKTKQVWHEESYHASEPVFIPNPGSKEEDDGILLITLIPTAKKNQNMVALLVLDAKNLTEIGRTVFETPTPVPFSFHGWYCDSK